MELYYIVKKCAEQEKFANLLLGVGDPGIEKYNSFVSTLPEGEKENAKTIFDTMIEQLEPAENFRVCRLKLMGFRQEQSECLDNFVNRCRLMASKCDFSGDEMNDRIIELIIASTPIEDYQKDLLEKDKKYKLKDAITLGRTYEAAKEHSRQLKLLNQSAKVPENSASENSISALDKQKFRRGVMSRSVCKNCGKDHKYGKEHCPARLYKCNKCGRMGHWASVCLSREAQQSVRGRARPMQRNRRVNAIEDYDEEYVYEETGLEQEIYENSEYDYLSSDLENVTFNNILVSSVNRDEAFVTLKTEFDHLPGRQNLVLKVDTGAQGNTLPFRVFQQIFPHLTGVNGEPLKGAVKPTNHVLSAYNNTRIKCAGVIDIYCCFENTPWQYVEFYVVDVPGHAILGLPTSEKMNIVTLHCTVKKESRISTVQDLVREYPDQFDKIGCFPNVHQLKTDPNVQPRIDAPRRVPIALKEKIKCELDKMVSQDVIRPIEEPTEWVSSLTYVTKKDGSLRVCLDPRALNKALIRPAYQNQTVEEINHKFSNAKVFSKLDAKAGYWTVRLDEKSQKLTTFQSPFGRFCFKRLPFGLKVSQDIFQLEMDRLLEKCSGACGIADDIVIFGRNEEEHDSNLRQFMRVAKEHGLQLNSEKCEIKRDQISFFGNLYTANGMRPDPKKIKDLLDMPAPKNKSDLKNFLGFLTYLSKFISNFSHKSASLRDMLKQDSQFLWEEHHQRTFESLKKEITEDSCLKYFEPQKRVVVQCDASLKGLGVALLQPDDEEQLRPVAFASKSLTPTEQRYACIERELLAIVFATKRFHSYLYGKFFEVRTDHRPLVMILDKSMAATPTRLQRMVIQLQDYNFSVEYVPGSQNVIADSLSRLPSPENSEISLDLRVDLVRFSSEKLLELKTSTAQDAQLNHLKEVIMIGWPENIKETASHVREYWSLRDQLTVEDGIILKGQQVVIPASMKQDILRQLHTAHLGIEKTKLLAKDTVFWLNMTKDIEQLVNTCEVCQKFKNSQSAEPLQSVEFPDRIWHTVGVDIFYHEKDAWLLVADYYSKFPVVRKLPNPSPSVIVVEIMKCIFSEYGIPKKIISDNGPHFVSEVFRKFTLDYVIDHMTSSPRRAQGNGFAERNVQTIKNFLQKALDSKTDPYLALLHWRTVPLATNLPSPAEIMMGRRLRSTLMSNIKNDNKNRDEMLEHLQQRQQTQKSNFDRKARSEDYAPLFPGQQVYVQQEEKGLWRKAEVQSRVSNDPRSYIVRDNSTGNTIRRNRQQIREQVLPTPHRPPLFVPCNPPIQHRTVQPRPRSPVEIVPPSTSRPPNDENRSLVSTNRPPNAEDRSLISTDRPPNVERPPVCPTNRPSNVEIRSPVSTSTRPRLTQSQSPSCAKRPNKAPDLNCVPNPQNRMVVTNVPNSRNNESGKKSIPVKPVSPRITRSRSGRTVKAPDKLNL